MTDLDNGADLRERFDHALADLAAPQHLTAGVLTDGRRLRRRRRILTGTGGVATVAAVTAFVVASLGGGSPSAEPDLATEPTAPKSSESLSGLPSSAPAGPNDPFPEAPAGWWDMPSEEMAANLEALLPDGVAVTDVDTVMDDVPPGQDPVTTGIIRATLEIDAGPGGFEILLYPPEISEVPDPVTTTDANGNENTTAFAASPSCPAEDGRFDECTEIHLSGRPLSGRATVTTPGDIAIYEVTLSGANGGLLYFATTNSVDDKWGSGSPRSAERPPLTIAELRDLALNMAWTSYQP